MNYLYIAGGSFAVLLTFFMGWILTFRLRARNRVRHRTDDEKCRDLNKALDPFGFQYDINQDIFLSKRDAWQRNMGYGRIYDVNAINTNMVIDCEPIYFTFNKRSYMLEFWKGQYGLSTGAEIGFYVTDEIDEEHPEKLFYHCVTDQEMLSMRFVLRKQGRILMIRDEIHWWLTGFVLGEFSRTEDLSMDVAIVFSDYQMRNAFCIALANAGYDRDSIYISGLRVSFNYTRPHTKQPNHTKLRIRFTQGMNKSNCKRYHRVTRHFTRTIDKVDYLGMCFPGIYKLLGAFSRISTKKKTREKETRHGRNRV